MYDIKAHRCNFHRHGPDCRVQQDISNFLRDKVSDSDSINEGFNQKRTAQKTQTKPQSRSEKVQKPVRPLDKQSNRDKHGQKWQETTQ